MSAAQTDSAALRAVEAIMLDKYRSEPFHNLHLLYGEPPYMPALGGTCSDKTLNLLQALDTAGFDAKLHSGYIGGQEIHRLAKVTIDERSFFADVGNGWPALRLYPLDREVSYACFGMGFRTELSDHHMTVYHRRNGVEARQLDIDFEGKPEPEIRADIAARFVSDIDYPFRNALRFSLLVKDRFLFLRGERLEIYHADSFEVVEGINSALVPEILNDYFGLDFESLIRAAR